MELDKGNFEGNSMFELKQKIKDAIVNFGMPFVLNAIDQAIIDLNTTDEAYFRAFNLAVLYSKKAEMDEYNKEIGLKISQVAVKRYGLKLVSKRCVCPFHKGARNKTSLTFNDEKNIFRCFSCGEKGDLFTFIKKMEELNGNKKRS